MRIGVRAWALLGVLLLAAAVFMALGRLSVVVIPLVLALFPAAILAPPTRAMIRRGLPPAPAALLSVLLGGLVVAAVVAFLVPPVADELDGVVASVEEGLDQLEGFLASGPFGLPETSLGELLARARAQLLAGGGALGQQALTIVTALVEGVAAFLLGLVALFFYLKDGPKLAGWLRNLFPRRYRAEAQEVGLLAWETVGGYIRGQLLIALVDAVLIGVGIAIVGVPLVLPLAVLVFLGGLFPLVGAVVAGAVAVLVALATVGTVEALIVLGIILVVQEIEGDVLAPIVLGRATSLHPLAVLAALAAGAVLLGILGAFLAVPLLASVARAVGYLRERQEAATSPEEARHAEEPEAVPA